MNWLFANRLRSFVALAAVVSLVLNIALLMPAIYMMQVFDRVFASRSVETLVMLGAITLLFLALGYFLDTVRTRTLAWAGRSLERQLAPAAVRGSLEQAALGARADSDALRDITSLRAFLSGPGVLALFDAPWLIVYLLIITLMHPLLGFAAATGALALVLLGVLTERLTREHTEQTSNRSRTVTRLAEKLGRNAEAIIGMGMAGTVVARWGVHHEELLNAQQQHIGTSSALAAMARTLRQALQVIILGIGAWLVIGMEASAGIMIAATILLSRALQPIEYLISGWRVMINARSSWRRLSESVASTSQNSKLALPTPAGHIDAERLTYGFKSTNPPLLRAVSFSIAAGESLGVIGASASGKTTLIRLLLGLWKPQAGVVRYDRADVSLWDRDALGKHIGYLPQGAELFAGTVAENIARLGETSADASERIIRAAKLARAHELILQLPDGYDTQIGEGGAVLSGGQRQRIALARALYGDPQVIVLDEPEANLDAAGQAALLAALADLKSRKATVIVVSHNAALFAAVDKLALLKNGMLDMFGPSAAVIARLRAAPPAGRIVSFPMAKDTEALA